ncbi:MAG: MBL fold metallo-hydrolase [Ilumatobacteraceae bacterium]
MANAPVLSFLGGAHTVTGSKTLVEAGAHRLLVDAGLFQGRKELRLRNWEPLPVDASSIDAVLLTHAHIDHCGFLPRLVRDGFTGPVYCTAGTRALASIVLPDSAHLQEEEAEYANRRGSSRHRPARPLYTGEDAAAALGSFRSVEFGDPTEVLAGIDVTWRRAGHILGASSLSIRVGDGGPTIAFSGDLGRPTHPLLLPPDPIGAADVVVIESTYGDQEHRDVDPSDALAAVVNDTAARGGVVVIPAFAVDRTEVVLWYLDQLAEQGRIPDLPVFVDSPMANRALDLYRHEVRGRSPELRPELFGRELFSSLNIVETTTPAESMALNDRTGPFVIVSASGMATGGRVVHHLAHRLGDPRNTIALVGFQAPGTRGDRLRGGAGAVKIFGQYHPVRAEVASVDLSTHADRSELLDWLATAHDPEVVFVNHGEVAASTSLADEIRARTGRLAVVPAPDERVVVTARRR